MTTNGEKGKVLIEKGEVSPAQMKEIEAGDYVTVAQVATRLRYSRAWISSLCKQGFIKAVKPIGGQWRIPKSEWDRVISEGIPPLPREEPSKPAVTELEVPEDKLKRVAPEATPETKKEEKRGPRFPIDFGGLFR